MTSLENGGNAGALIPVPGTRYDRPVVERALRSTWNLRRRPRVGGAEQQIGQSRVPLQTGQSGVPRRYAPALEPRPEQVAARWLRGLVPADSSQPITVTFDSWHHPGTGTEIAVDSHGTLAVANHGVVQTALRIINSGQSVVVQVTTGQTVRVWVFNRKRAQAIDAATLEQNHLRNARLLDGGEASRPTGVRFVTGWVVTGEPGGARSAKPARSSKPARRAQRRSV